MSAMCKIMYLLGKSRGEGEKKITFYNGSQITKQQLKIVMEIARQSSWLTAKTNFGCTECLRAKFQPTEFTPKLGVKGKTSLVEMEIGSPGGELHHPEGSQNCWLHPPTSSQHPPAPSSTPQFPPTFPSSSRGAFEPAGITPCPKQAISCPLSLCPGKASPHPLPPQCSPSRTDPSAKSTKGEMRQRGTNTWLLNIIGFYYTFLLTH